MPSGASALATKLLPRSGKAPILLTAGSFDECYLPTRDYRKPFDGRTPLTKLAESKAALEILFRLVPPLGGMARDKDPEFGTNGLEDFRGMGFLPIEPDKLEQAIEELKELIVEEETT